MNLRDIKKDIDYILSAFIEDCSVVAAVNSKVSEEKASAFLDDAIALYNELRDKVNVKATDRTSPGSGKRRRFIRLSFLQS